MEAIAKTMPYCTSPSTRVGASKESSSEPSVSSPFPSSWSFFLLFSSSFFSFSSLLSVFLLFFSSFFSFSSLLSVFLLFFSSFFSFSFFLSSSISSLVLLFLFGPAGTPAASCNPKAIAGLGELPRFTLWDLGRRACWALLFWCRH